MAKAKQGDDVSKKSEGVQAAANEFAPTIINNGDGTNVEVQPAPAPEASMQNDAGADAGPEAAEEREREFVSYVNNVLKEEADFLGYDLKLAKRNRSNVGPVMYYNPESLEGSVFGSRAEAPAGWLSGDELQARQAAARGE